MVRSSLIVLTVLSFLCLLIFDQIIFHHFNSPSPGETTLSDRARRLGLLDVIYQHKRDIICQVKEVVYKYRSDDGEYIEKRSWSCRDEESPDVFYKLDAIPEIFVEQYDEVLSYGNSWIRIRGANKGKWLFKRGTIYIPKSAEMELLSLEESRQKNDFLDFFIGTANETVDNFFHTKPVLVVRISAFFSYVSLSKEELSNSIFGEQQDSVNLRSIFEDCSNGKVRMRPARGPFIDNGVINLPIFIPIFLMPVDLVEIVAQIILRLRIGPLLPRFRHVMFCFPESVEDGFIAYAYKFTHMSFYNNKWCSYPSAQVHEIGHNYGLGHSGYGNSRYGDTTGMMGFSYPRTSYPRKCFNAPKSWGLRWYKDKTKIYVPLLQKEAFTAKLVSVDGYKNATKGEHIMIIKVILSGVLVPTPMFVMFNEQAGINSDTDLFPNQLTIVRSLTSKPTKSNLICGVSVGESTRIRIGVRFLVVEFCSYNTTDSPTYANINMFLEGSSSDPLLSCLERIE